MSTTVQDRTPQAPTRTLPATLGPALVIAGVAFAIGGATHPGDSGRGNKAHQLHDSLVSSTWYPSHVLLLAAMGLFAVTITVCWRSGYRSQQPAPGLGLVMGVAWLTVASMVTHLLAPLDASSIAHGETSWLLHLQQGNEAIDACWGLAMATYALLSGRIGLSTSPLVALLGVGGGLAFALASATIPYTDTFDPLFKASSLLSIWAVIVGATVLSRRRARERSRSLPVPSDDGSRS